MIRPFIKNTRPNGSAIIFLVTVTAIMLVTTTTVATRLAISEISQSSNVERSDQAYYAAEAGVEEALKRLDDNPDMDLDQLFPEQYNGTNLPGDQAVLLDQNGDVPASIDITQDGGILEIGQLAWRQRRVYDSQSLDGPQVKDQTVEFDTSQLRRKTNIGTFGSDGRDSDGSNIFATFDGLEYCWVPSAGTNPDIEFTIISWQTSNAQVVTTSKAIFNSGSSTHTFPGVGSLALSSAVIHNNETCAQFTDTRPNRRYIFRIRPLFQNVGDQPATVHNTHKVDYRVKLLDERNLNEPLYIPNNMIDIDVVGQSGEIRRRIVARKLRNGRLLGIFDYVLYSGDPNAPLCKAGIQQTDVGYNSFCNVNSGTAGNNNAVN